MPLIVQVKPCVGVVDALDGRVVARVDDRQPDVARSEQSHAVRAQNSDSLICQRLIMLERRGGSV